MGLYSYFSVTILVSGRESACKLVGFFNKNEEMVMKSKVFTAAVVVFLFCDWCIGDPNTRIRYDATDLGSGR